MIAVDLLTRSGHVQDFNRHCMRMRRKNPAVAGFAHLKTERCKERTNVKRVNSCPKDSLGGCDLRIRGYQREHCHPMFGILALAVDQFPPLAT